MNPIDLFLQLPLYILVRPNGEMACTTAPWAVVLWTHTDAIEAFTQDTGITGECVAIENSLQWSGLIRNWLSRGIQAVILDPAINNPNEFRYVPIADIYRSPGRRFVMN